LPAPSRFIQENFLPVGPRLIDLGASLLRWATVWTYNLNVSGTATVPTPVNSTDAATKAYVDSLSGPVLASVEEADGSPSITNPTTLRVDQGDGFVLTEPSSGVARLDLAAVPNSVLANSTVTVTAGTGLSGGGAIALGGSATLNISTVPVANGGTGLTTGTSGGVLAYTAAGTLASSGALAAKAVVLGGGAGAVPTSLTDPGADRLLFWDESADSTAYLTVGSGLTITGTTITAAASLSGLSSIQLVRKTSDETVNNSSTLQDDDTLLAALAASEVVTFQCFIIFDSGTTPNFKAAFTVPGGATIVYNWSSGISIDTSLAAGRENTASASGTALVWGGYGVGSKAAATLTGTVINGATPGNLTLQWAQNTANASNTKVYAGSFLLVFRV
jgi:hypothetical protein